MWSRLKLDSALLTRSRSRSLVGPPDPFFIRFGRALFLFGSLLLYRWISSFKDLAQSRFELWFDLDGRWQRKRSDNRDYVPSVEERKWKFWNFPQWLAEALFVIIVWAADHDAGDLFTAEEEKSSSNGSDKYVSHKKSIFLAAIFPVSLLILVLCQRKRFDPKSAWNLRLWALCPRTIS